MGLRIDLPHVKWCCRLRATRAGASSISEAAIPAQRRGPLRAYPYRAEELDDALQAGTIRESHVSDLKRELPKSGLKAKIAFKWQRNVRLCGTNATWPNADRVVGKG